MNDLYIQGVHIDWNKIPVNSYLREIDAIKGLEELIFHGIFLMGVPSLHILPLLSPHYKNSLLSENIPILLDGIPLQHV